MHHERDPAQPDGERPGPGNATEQHAAPPPTGSTSTAYDLSHTIEPTSWYGTVLAATINVTPSATVFEVTIWLAYAIVVLFLFFRPVPKRAPAAA